MSSYIIGGIKYTLEKRNLLCEFTIAKAGVIIDFQSKTKRLYYPKGKAFVMDTVQDMTGEHDPKVISKSDAMEFMDKHPAGIDIKNYIKFFGDPKEL